MRHKISIRHKHGRLIGLFVAAVLTMGLCGCGSGSEAWYSMTENNEINIALVGDGEFFTYGGALDAMKLAAADFEEENGTKVNIITYDDMGDYNTGVTLASQIAEDKSIHVAISKQELDIIDTIASIFEDKKKPLIVTNGCYDSITGHGNEYLITDFINAKTTGQYMGQYAIEEGYSSIAYCHSNTEYEKDELKGVQSCIKGSGTNIIDTVIGPFSQEEFNECYERWVSLGVDAVYISIYDYLYGSDIIRMLRQKGSDIPVMTDYAMANENDIEINGEYMDGTVILPLYPYGENEKYRKISDAFYDEYGYESTESVIQSYELIQMISSYLVSGVKSSAEFMQCMKSEEGHETTAGTIHFDKNGVLVMSDVWYLKFDEGAFKLYRNTGKTGGSDGI